MNNIDHGDHSVAHEADDVAHVWLKVQHELARACDALQLMLHVCMGTSLTRYPGIDAHTRVMHTKSDVLRTPVDRACTDVVDWAIV